MIFKETLLQGTYIIEPARFSDDRGFFARTYCAREFEERGLNAQIVQCNVSWNRRAGTLRGMHYQRSPAAEDKLVRCTRGAIYDVALDLRADSPTFRRWVATELSSENRHMMYIPRGVAHGFQTLEDDCEVFYQMSEFHAADLAMGVRWDDPAFAIAWPETAQRTMSARDLQYPLFSM